MTLTLNDLIRNGILNALASLFHNQERADMLLELIDFPHGMRPIFPNDGRILGYWQGICREIQSGAVPGGTDLQPLIDAAAELYPSNSLFQQYCSDRTQPNNPNTQSSNTTSLSSSNTSQIQQVNNNNNLFIISIQGRDDVNNLLASDRVVAPGQNISSENINLRFSRNGIVLLGLNHCSSEAVASFAELLQTILQSNQNSVRVNVLTEDPQPYLISRIYVEGPDQARFAIEDIPSDTTVEEIAKGVMSEGYDLRMMQDGRGGGRPVVIDRVNEDGSTERLPFDQTLHEANIQEDDTLESIVFPTFSKNSCQSKCQLQVFLCHSSNDKPTVRKLYEQLLNDGFQPWLDEENILPGQNWELEIQKAVRNADVVVVWLSKSSVNKTGYIQKEIKFALDIAEQQPEGSIFIVPVKIEDCDVPQRLCHYQWLNWFLDPVLGYKKLLKSLKQKADELGFIQSHNDNRLNPSQQNNPTQRKTRKDKPITRLLNLQTITTNGLLNELAKCCADKMDAYLLLKRINFPDDIRPRFENFDNSRSFWLNICEKIEQGQVQNNFEELLAEAACLFPGNPVFASFK